MRSMNGRQDAAWYICMVLGCVLSMVVSESNGDVPYSLGMFILGAGLGITVSSILGDKDA